MKHEPGSEDCKRIFEKLSEYLDEQLTAEMRSHIEGHLEDCPPCVDFLESLRRTVRLVETVEAPPLPEEIRREVLGAYARFKTERAGEAD